MVLKPWDVCMFRVHSPHVATAYSQCRSLVAARPVSAGREATARSRSSTDTTGSHTSMGRSFSRARRPVMGSTWWPTMLGWPRTSRTEAEDHADGLGFAFTDV